MKHQYFLYASVITLCVSALTVCGCARTRQAKFYLLHPLQEAAAEKKAASSLAIGIGPVDIPEYLDRPQIVTRISPNEIQLADFDRWGEPLQENFSRVLAENLSMLLATDHVTIFPWTGSPHIDYRVSVAVIRFDGSPGNAVLLNSRWMIIREADKKTLMEKKSTISIPAEGQDFEKLVAAQSRAVADLSREIATAMQTITLQRAVR
jgi:hypothetical protein